jgi:hypothetical protein
LLIDGQPAAHNDCSGYRAGVQRVKTGQRPASQPSAPQ